MQACVLRCWHQPTAPLCTYAKGLGFRSLDRLPRVIYISPLSDQMGHAHSPAPSVHCPRASTSIPTRPPEGTCPVQLTGAVTRRAATSAVGGLSMAHHVQWKGAKKVRSPLLISNCSPVRAFAPRVAGGCPSRTVPRDNRGRFQPRGLHAGARKTDRRPPRVQHRKNRPRKASLSDINRAAPPYNPDTMAEVRKLGPAWTAIGQVSSTVVRLPARRSHPFWADCCWMSWESERERLQCRRGGGRRGESALGKLFDFRYPLAYGGGSSFEGTRVRWGNLNAGGYGSQYRVAKFHLKSNSFPVCPSGRCPAGVLAGSPARAEHCSPCWAIDE